MKAKKIVVVILLGALCAGCVSVKPVTPDASPEAVALLKYIRGLSGKHTLTGQHNYPNTGNASTEKAARTYGKTPVIFGQDFGFSATDKDSILSRSNLVAEAEREYKKGEIIALCWHAVPPTADEPVTFLPQPGTPPGHLASVQGRLTDEQWNELLTPGTKLYDHWRAQVDVIAGYLQQLRDARVPVLWRPYHEMNGDWFWWGGRRGERGTVALYRQLFDRLAKYHKLNNLVWVWSLDRPTRADRQFADYFPGKKYFDVAALDVYHSDFQQSYYNDLLKLADGKPITLAEVGPPPTIDVLEKQPMWTYWMLWAGMVPTNSDGIQAVKTLVDDPRSFSLEDPKYRRSISSIRAASGLPPLQK